ncbi:MAG: methyltransferase domain-containing protein, partial [Myxococcales bacterium]|nr:methyltransferase domain-containing protein [Myxococcales bacterium]
MRLSFADATFDAVVLALVLCSLPAIDRVVTETWRGLRRGPLPAIERAGFR